MATESKTGQKKQLVDETLVCWPPISQLPSSKTPATTNHKSFISFTCSLADYLTSVGDREASVPKQVNTSRDKIEESAVVDE